MRIGDKHRFIVFFVLTWWEDIKGRRRGLSIFHISAAINKSSWDSTVVSGDECPRQTNPSDWALRRVLMPLGRAGSSSSGTGRSRLALQRESAQRSVSHVVHKLYKYVETFLVFCLPLIKPKHTKHKHKQLKWPTTVLLWLLVCDHSCSAGRIHL